MELKVIGNPIPLTWLVRDISELIPMGKTAVDMSVPVWKYGGVNWNRGWVTCQRCGTFAGTTRPDGDHIEAVKTYEGRIN